MNKIILLGVTIRTEAYNFSDGIYIQSWKGVLRQCEKKLEPDDYERALMVETLETFCDELNKLQALYVAEGPKQVILLLYPALPHCEEFSKSYVKLLSE